jgi:hypothetical protein
MRRRLLGWTIPAIVLLLVPGLLGTAGCARDPIDQSERQPLTLPCKNA